MRHDEFQSQVDRAACAAAGEAPPAFLRTVTRRRWKRRLPAIGAAAVVLAGAWVASLWPRADSIVPPAPVPEWVADTPAPSPIDTSLATLRREGLAARAFNEALPASTAPAVERPLRAFEVSRVLRGF